VQPIRCSRVVMDGLLLTSRGRSFAEHSCCRRIVMRCFLNCVFLRVVGREEVEERNTIKQ
jgi:hypothetical protein